MGGWLFTCCYCVYAPIECNRCTNCPLKHKLHFLSTAGNQAKLQTRRFLDLQKEKSDINNEIFTQLCVCVCVFVCEVCLYSVLLLCQIQKDWKATHTHRKALHTQREKEREAGGAKSLRGRLTAGGRHNNNNENNEQQLEAAPSVRVCACTWVYVCVCMHVCVPVSYVHIFS